jgi:hypothetical protein
VLRRGRGAQPYAKSQTDAEVDVVEATREEGRALLDRAARSRESPC